MSEVPMSYSVNIERKNSVSPVKITMKCEVGLHLVNKVLFPAVVISTSARFAVDKFWALAAPASKEARAKEYFILLSSPDQGDATDHCRASRGQNQVPLYPLRPHPVPYEGIVEHGGVNSGERLFTPGIIAEVCW